MTHLMGFKGQPYDAMIQLRCRRTTLATIAKYLIMNEKFFNSRSQLARMGLELAEELIVTQEKVVPVKDFVEADEWLGKFGIPRESLNTSGHGLHRYIRILQEENARLERGEYAEAGFNTNGLEPEPTARVTKKKKPEEIDPALRTAFNDEMERRAEERKQRDHNEKIQLGQIGDNVSIVEE